ncbi:MAG: hypothetical protein WCA17_06910 [Burkholderiales bacterium]
MSRSESWLRAGTVAASIAVIVLLTFVPPGTNDLWLQEAIGRIIWTNGEIPRTALFPFTEASQLPFYAHEWLSSLAFYLLDHWLGHRDLIFVKGLLGLALFGLCARMSFRLSRSLFASLVVSLAAMATENFRFFLRPELFALLFTVIILGLLVEFRAGGRWRHLAACTPVAFLWANSHGSFPVALILAAAFAAGAAIEAFASTKNSRLEASAHAAGPYLICAVLMALVMLLNPYGAHLFRFAWDLENAAFVRSYVYEWTPTLYGLFVGSRGFWAFMLFLAFSAAVLYVGRREVPVAGWLLLLIFGCLALGTSRHIAFFAVVSVYPLSAAIRGIASRLEPLPLVRGAVLALLIACAGLVVRYGNLYGDFPYHADSNNFSLLLVEFLDRPQLRGNVLNSYVLGSELIYRYYPRLRPAIDSRVDVYGKKYLLELLRLNNDERALKAFIARYHVDYILLLWRDFDQGIRHMPHLRDDGWRIIFADGKVVLLGRPSSTAHIE